MNLLQKLKGWRTETAKREGVELFRILSNRTIDELAIKKPSSSSDLLEIHGIKEKKMAKYGEEILAIVGSAPKGTNEPPHLDLGGPSGVVGEALSVKDAVAREIVDNRGGVKGEDGVQTYAVSDYLNILNFTLRNSSARIVGEISSLDIRGNYLFFSLKDKEDESLLNCFMWMSNYKLSAVELKEGMEIVVSGSPEVYKPSCRLSLKVSTVELVGEGALKKAYEDLRKKLEKEGLFSVETKRSLPEFPQTIGLVTSETGAVIHDFLNNIGKYNYKIKFYNSRVEGQVAVKNLISAVKYFENVDIDVLVVIRGGGSMESLQAFNNEVLVRRIAGFNKPVICGIGHDKDVPLASYVADKAVSTPTAVAKLLDESWNTALSNVALLEKEMLHSYHKLLIETRDEIDSASGLIRGKFHLIFANFEKLVSGIKNANLEIEYDIKKIKDNLKYKIDLIVS